MGIEELAIARNEDDMATDSQIEISIGVVEVIRLETATLNSNALFHFFNFFLHRWHIAFRNSSTPVLLCVASFTYLRRPTNVMDVKNEKAPETRGFYDI
jgi:hypothetical protein